MLSTPSELRPGRCLDKGYDYSEVYGLLHEAGFRARRLVVERTHSWLNRFRRLLIRWENAPNSYIGMLHLACGLIAWREACKDPLTEIGSKSRLARVSAAGLARRRRKPFGPELSDVEATHEAGALLAEHVLDEPL